MSARPYSLRNRRTESDGRVIAELCGPTIRPGSSYWTIFNPHDPHEENGKIAAGFVTELNRAHNEGRRIGFLEGKDCAGRGEV